MARLFIGPREQSFISDITKEIIKDVIAQKIILYTVSEIKTQAHEVYNEAPQKVYDNPLEIDALVGDNNTEMTKNEFGLDYIYTIEAYIQWADLVDKNISVNIGDFFQFGGIFYEITGVEWMRNIYGQPDHVDGYKIVGTKAREGLFKSKIVGPTDYVNTDEDAVQTTFVQQRGQESNRLGKTNDKRDLQESGVLDPPLSGPREVSPKGDPTGAGAAFYDED
jgi:hypothetical protein